MPTHDSVGLHDDQGRSPILPRLGEQDPKQSISCAKVRAPDRAPENRQLLTQRHVLERDGAVSTTEQSDRSKQHDKRCKLRVIFVFPTLAGAIIIPRVRLVLEDRNSMA